MLFPFTFSFSVPGIMNPFSKSPDLSNDAGDSPAPAKINNLEGKRWIAVRRPRPSALPLPVPLARKRGWKPSSPEPSPAVAVTTSTRGHLNLPPKYRDFTVTPEAREEEQETEEMAAGKFHVHLTDFAYISSVVSPRVLASVHIPFSIYALQLHTCHVCPMLFLLMAPMCTQCMLFTLLYIFALLWAFFGLMVISFHVCIEFPPAKRRRTLAGAFVSSAVNAALIGTAVGLTVYRLYVLSCTLSSAKGLIPFSDGEIGVRPPNWNLHHMNRVTGSPLKSVTFDPSIRFSPTPEHLCLDRPTMLFLPQPLHPKPHAAKELAQPPIQRCGALFAIGRHATRQNCP
jgi:hypothetical protein